jgi:hypothetical protein
VQSASELGRGIATTRAGFQSVRGQRADIRDFADKSEFGAHRLAALAVSCFGPVSLRLYIHRRLRRRDRANRSNETMPGNQGLLPSRTCSFASC